MAKLKPLSLGLALGVFLVICYVIRTIVIWLFPNFVVNLAKKVTYNMLALQPPVITIDAFVIGLVVLFVGGLITGIIFAWVYNWVGK
ncbi:hypothetical protein HYX02_06590 [Candidatus Woesearchaeota archaeon]|nr:hypothetical protein [Candidatus Woesearchaeota archaeon]